MPTHTRHGPRWLLLLQTIRCSWRRRALVRTAVVGAILAGGVGLLAVDGRAQEAAAEAEAEAAEEKGEEPPANPLTGFLKKLLGGGSDEAEGDAAEPDTEAEQGRQSDPIDHQVISDNELNKTLETATEHAEAAAEGDEERWIYAVRLMQEVIDHPYDTLWRRDDGTWVSLRTEAEARVGRLGPAGLREYRVQYAEAAAQLLQREGGLADIDACVQVADRYFHTDAGYQAANAVAGAYFDRTEYRVAAAWFERLWEAAPPLTETSEWRVRAAYCLMKAGRPGDAQSLLDALAADPPADLVFHLPDGQAANTWLAEVSADRFSPTPVLQDWPMIHGTSSHVGTTEGGEPLLLERWSEPLTYRHAIELEIDELLLDMSDNDRAGIPALFPIVVDGKVAFRTLRGLSVADVRTGRPVWESRTGVSPETLLSGEAEPTFSSRQMGFRRIVSDYSPTQFDHHQLTSLLFRDAVNGLLSSDGKRLYAVENNAVMVQSNYGYWWNNVDPSSQDPYGRDWTSNQIVAYDFESGRPLWEVGGRRMLEPFDPPLAGTFFFGPPVADGNELFAIGERDKQVELFALAQENGRLLWSLPLTEVSTTVDRDAVRRMWACVPAVDAATIVCPTSCGWLYAIDRDTHRIRWAHRFEERVERQGFRGGAATAHSLQPLNSRWCSSPPILASGCVLHTPSEQPSASGIDQPRLTCLDALTGEILWEQEKQDGLYLAGVFDDAAVIVGRTTVRAVSLSEQGKTLWKREIPAEQGPPSGRAAPVGKQLLLPLQTGRLWTLNIENGELASEMQVREGRPPLGNLVMHDATLLSLGPDGLTGFEQRDVVLQEIAEHRAADAGDLWAAVRDAEVNEAEGRYAAALESLDRATPVDADDQELRERHRGLTFRMLVEIASRNRESHEREFERARDLAEGADEEIAVSRLAAERESARGNTDAAFNLYWRMTEQYPHDYLLTDGLVTIRLDQWLSGRLLDVWRSGDEELQAEITRRISDRTTEVLAGPPEEWGSFERLFGFHPAAQPVLWAAVEAAVARGEFAPAEVRLRRMAANPDPSIGASAWLRLGELLLQFEQPVDAADCFVRLTAEPYADVTLANGVRCGDAAAERMQAAGVGPESLALPPVSVWSNEAFEVTRSRIQYNRYYGGSQDPDLSDEAGWFFRRHRVEFDQQTSSLSIVRAADDHLHWMIPLRMPQQNAYNQTVGVLTSGLQMVALHRGVLHAVSPVDRTILWTRQLPGRGPNSFTRQVYFDQVQNMHPATSFVAQSGLARSQAGQGMLALATPNYVAHYGRAELVVVDPLTGELLWRRRGILPNTTVCGDVETIYVMPPNINDATALRARDGAPLEIDRLSDLLKDSVALTDDGCVTVDTPRGDDRKRELRIRAVDPASREIAWSHYFAIKSELTRLGETSLLVLNEETGECAVVDLGSGERSVLGTVSKEILDSATQIHAVADSEFVYVLVDHLNNHRHSYVNPPVVRVNGTVIALPRNGEGKAWSRQVESQNLLLTQFTHSPLMVFLSYEHVTLEKSQYGYAKVRLLVLDKGTGRVVVDDERASPNGNHYQLAVNRTEGLIEIRSYNEVLRIQATGEKLQADAAAK
ncbi:MAG: hypothetical protein DWQ45_19150 [Planctomycetota bacterium]|nr:MAG: hypothetical protein DWQ41_11535 [Planctomycetota bacterium]REK31723.1 MAG: hypothetical protein DWQ45_19150 [Planctomycetota bacterium]